MPRMYRVPYSGTITSAGTDTDLIIIEPADDKPCRLAGWILGQYSEFGDSAEEAIRITLRHMTATVTKTGGSSVATLPPNRPGTTDVVAAAFTATANCTTVATSSGTSTIMEELAWNIRSSPWERYIPEEMRPTAIQGEALIVRMESTLVDDISAALTFFIEEGF